MLATVLLVAGTGLIFNASYLLPPPKPGSRAYEEWRRIGRSAAPVSPLARYLAATGIALLFAGTVAEF
jgi:hypothetical protein